MPENNLPIANSYIDTGGLSGGHLTRQAWAQAEAILLLPCDDGWRPAEVAQFYGVPESDVLELIAEYRDELTSAGLIDDEELGVCFDSDAAVRIGMWLVSEVAEAVRTLLVEHAVTWAVTCKYRGAKDGAE